MALTDLSDSPAGTTDSTGTASDTAAQQLLPSGTNTVTVQSATKLYYGYTSAGCTIPIAADTPLAIPIGGGPLDSTPKLQLWLKADAGTPYVHLDCSPFARS